MAPSPMAVLKRSFASLFAAALFVLPVFAFAQVYGGGNYGGGNYNTGDVQVSTGDVTVSGGGQVVGSSPTAPGYVNTNPTGGSTSTLVAPTIPVASSSTASTTTSASSSGGSALTEAQIQSILSILQSFGADQSVVDSVNASLRGTASAGSTSSFTRDLEAGMEGNDVKALQIYLNTHGYMLTDSGAGSTGKETTLFGALTRAALIKFQSDHGITPAAGYFGPKTRAAIGQ